MNDYKLPPDDPRLTAYALGELDPAEHAAVEAALRDDPAARAAVEQIRGLAAQLTDALAHEPMPEAAGEKTASRREPAKVHRFPVLYYVIGGAAAAGFALFFALRPPPPPGLARAPQVPEASPAAKTVTAVVQLSPAVPAEEKTESAAQVLADAARTATPAPSATLAATAPAAADTGTAEVREVTANAVSGGRTHTFPPDEKFLANAEPAKPAGADKAVILAVPQAPAVVLVPSGNVASAPAASPLIPPSTSSLTVTSDAGATRLAASPLPAPAPGALPPSSATLAAPANDLVRLDSLAKPVEREVLFGSERATARGIATPRAQPGDAFVSPLRNPVATFAVSPDNSSYAAIRRFLELKRLPPREAVRTADLVNHFPYRYAPPKGDAPFAAAMEVAEAPWAASHLLVRIGLKAREVASLVRPPANLALVIDAIDTDRVKNRLPLIKASVQSLIAKLRPDDRVALVTCDGPGRIALPPTPVARAREILDALDALAPGTQSRRVQGLQRAYDLLQAEFAVGATNRVILCTDGNGSVTVTDEAQLLRYIDDRAKAGVSLAAFGYGMGIYRDELIDLLAGYRTGSFGYLDGRRDIETALVEDVNGPPVTIAKDVNVQVEFNPAKVASYRLIGYDNRALKKEDFPAEAFQTEEVGAGHAFTALFELVPAPAAAAGRAEGVSADGLRYQPPKALAAAVPVVDPNELLTVKVRYKKPGGAIRRRLDLPLADAPTRFVDASADFKFAAAVAGFGMVLSESPYKGTTTFASVVEWAESANAEDPAGYRGEFIGLAREAEKIRQ
jgi:Ca-activated chloride channel family protein